jgi:hypothetical protein
MTRYRNSLYFAAYLAAVAAILTYPVWSQYVAVRVHQGNPNGIPDGWPAETQAQTDDSVPAGWTFTTNQPGYAAYREALRPAYEAWRDAVQTTNQTKETNLRAEVRQTAQQLRQAYNNWDSLTANQRLAAQKLNIRLTLILTRQALNEGTED